jgi:hypothetical protein
VLSGEATNTNFIVFDLTRPGLEPTIYHTRGEHVNHYATDIPALRYQYQSRMHKNHPRHNIEISHGCTLTTFVMNRYQSRLYINHRWLIYNCGWYRYCHEGDWCATVTNIDIVTRVVDAQPWLISISASRGWLIYSRDWYRYHHEGGWCATVADIDIITWVVDIQPWLISHGCTRTTLVTISKSATVAH